MRTLLDESGMLRSNLSATAAKQALAIGTVIASVTSKKTASPREPIICWGKLNKKRCTGKIDACIDPKNFLIVWYCLRCGDNGIISHWQNTLWDEGFR